MTSDSDKSAQESRFRLFFIVVGSFVLYFNSWGMAQSFGVMYIELRDRFGGTRSDAAWVQSIFSGILLAAGPIAGILLKRFGCRLVAVAGSLILFVGLLTSSFITSLPGLYATYGFVGGSGGALIFTSAGVVLLEHFDKRKSLAVGIAWSGSSAGTIVIPLLTHACIDAYGFRGAFLVLSGVALQCLVVSLFFTRPPFHMQGIELEVSSDIKIDSTLQQNSCNDVDNVDSGQLTGCKIQDASQYTGCNPTDDTPHEASCDTVDEIPKQSGCKSYLSFINSGYAAFALSWAIVMFPFLVPFLILPDTALTRGVTKQEAAFIASSMGLGSMAGTAGFGFLGDIHCLETSLMHIVPIVLFGTLTLVYNFVSGFYSFLTLAIIIGLLSAIFDGIHPVITLQLVGIKDIGVGLGFLYFFMSISAVVGTPIAGWISEATGRYDEALYYCAGLSFLAATVALYIPCWKRRHKSR